MNYEAIIGLEVHAQLATFSKAWCSCEISPLSLENTKVCEICSAQPGTLPVLNKKVPEFAALLAFATDSKINLVSFFDRKNYFYPDLPKGYQITQYEKAFAENGFIEIEGDKGPKKIGIERIQIEEDTGKSTHEGESSLINLNRCGTPLIEIVGRPDIRSSKEASAYLKKLHSILTYLDICHGNLQHGNFRCDVNVSLRPEGTTTLGTRTEVKNINSFKFVEKAIEVEIDRQKKILESGEKVIQETLNFDPAEGKIKVLRSKSDAHDYRYFPEPDLLPLVVQQADLIIWREKLPELPEEKARRFVSSYDITPYDAAILCADKSLAKYFEETQKNHKGPAKKASNWILTELLRLLNEFNISVEKSPVGPIQLSEMLNFVQEGRISSKQAKDVFLRMYDNKISASQAIAALGVVQVDSEEIIRLVAAKIVGDNLDQVRQYLSGRDKVFGFFVGQLMKEMKGQANPQIASKIVLEEIHKIKDKI